MYGGVPCGGAACLWLWKGGKSSETDSPEEAAMKERFGEGCIEEQTFAVELNGYEGEVWFVPLAPSEENPEFRAKLVRDGKVLARLSSYVPSCIITIIFEAAFCVWRSFPIPYPHRQKSR